MMVLFSGEEDPALVRAATGALAVLSERPSICKKIVQVSLHHIIESGLSSILSCQWVEARPFIIEALNTDLQRHNLWAV